MYFDDLKVGQTFCSVGRTITETDVVLFAAITGANNELHTNQEAAKKTQFGERIAHGILTFAMTQGLFYRTAVLDSSLIALLGFDQLSFPKPVFFGDTICAQFEVAELVPSKSKADRGVVTLRVSTRKQTGEVVLTYTVKALVARQKGT